MKIKVLAYTVRADRVAAPPGFVYRRPVVREIRSMLDLDPDRLTPASEYPRHVSPPGPPDAETVDLVDLEARLYGPGDDGRYRLEVWFVPHPGAEIVEPVMAGWTEFANRPGDELVEYATRAILQLNASGTVPPFGRSRQEVADERAAREALLEDISAAALREAISAAAQLRKPAYGQSFVTDEKKARRSGP